MNDEESLLAGLEPGFPFLPAKDRPGGTMTEEGRKGFNFNLSQYKRSEPRDVAAPEPLLMLPAPQDGDAIQPDGYPYPPEKDHDHQVNFEPRSAEERAQEFLVEWVQRFSRA